MAEEFDPRINPKRLDEEWLKQPGMMYAWAYNKAAADRAADEAKNKLKVVVAKLDRELRSSPAEFGLTKATDAIIENALPEQPEYQVAYTAYLDAKYNADVHYAAVQALHQRKDALENLVRLHGMSYFAEPRGEAARAAEKAIWDRSHERQLAGNGEGSGEVL